MNEMVEQVAAAVAKARACWPPSEVDRAMARAAIAAMRLPTADMLTAIDSRSYGQPPAAYIIEGDGYDPASLGAELYTAMIDKALEA